LPVFGDGSKRLSALFVQILLIARQMACLKLGRSVLNGSKIRRMLPAPGLSYGHACKLEGAAEKLKSPNCSRKAEAADRSDLTHG